MATKTPRLNLNKGEGVDLVRSLLTDLFNENWDIIDTLARDSDLKDHVQNDNVHVTKDGTLQVGLNVEKLNGFTADQLSKVGHQHDNLYYPRSEADDIFARQIDVYTKQASDARYALGKYVYNKTIVFSNLDFCSEMNIMYSGSPSWQLYEGGYSGITYTGGANSEVCALATYEVTQFRFALIFSLENSATGKVSLIADYIDMDNALFINLDVATADIEVIRRVAGSDTTVFSSSLGTLPVRTVSGNDELNNFPNCGPFIVLYMETDKEDNIYIKTSTLTSLTPVSLITFTDVATIKRHTSRGRVGFKIADGNKVTLHGINHHMIPWDVDPSMIGATYSGLTERKYRVKPSGDIDGNNKVFILPEDIIENSEEVFLNGQLVEKDKDYTIAGRVITLTIPLPVDNKILVNYDVPKS